MDIQEIKQLIKIVEKSDIGELEIEEEGRKIRISKTGSAGGPAGGINGMMNPVYLQAPMPAPYPQSAPPPGSAATPAPEPVEAPDSDRYYEVRSPMVGTFYRSPSPDADPYVDVGDMVTNGSALCIIEAMKLMNEIKSDHSGKIARIMVENSQPVEYNQVLFLIEK